MWQYNYTVLYFRQYIKRELAAAVYSYSSFTFRYNSTKKDTQLGIYRQMLFISHKLCTLYFLTVSWYETLNSLQLPMHVAVNFWLRKLIRILSWSWFSVSRTLTWHVVMSSMTSTSAITRIIRAGHQGKKSQLVISSHRFPLQPDKNTWTIIHACHHCQKCFLIKNPLCFSSPLMASNNDGLYLQI